MSNYEVSPGLLSTAARCVHNHQCQRGELCGDCRVVCVIDGVLEIESDKRGGCPYHVIYGEGEVCTCPVRHEIRRKYGV